MPRLREVLTARGHADVRTHLRSGNVVLTSRAGRGGAGRGPLGGDRGGVRLRRPGRRPHRRGDRRRRRPGDPFADRGHRPGALPGHVPARAARPGPRRRAAEGRGRRRLPGPRAASSTCGCPTASRRRRWPPGSGTSCSARPGTARNWNTVTEAGRAERREAASVPGSDTRRRRFGRAAARPIRSCSACTDEGRERARGPARDRAGGRAGLAVGGTAPGRRPCSPGASRTSPSSPASAPICGGTRAAAARSDNAGERRPPRPADPRPRRDGLQRPAPRPGRRAGRRSGRPPTPT